MSLDAHSSEFARLVTAWLDETATAEQAAALWQAIEQSKECATEFAAAARFEALLEATVKERAAEKSVILQAATIPYASDRVPQRAAVKGFRHAALPVMIRLAAVLTVLGVASWLLWPSSETSHLSQSSAPKPKATTTVVSRLPAAAVKEAPGSESATADKSSALEKPLPQRLDQFFLAGVTLKQVPLHEALGILQGQLHELNFLNAEALKRLRITVPVDASNRRISFSSGPIAFLKAVRAVAALGGCEVTVDEATLALILHREIYPQVPERRDVRDVLAGRTNADGSDASRDPERLANLRADAASLGISIDLSRPIDAQTSVPVTRGQWVALQMLTDAREQLRMLPGASYQLYISGDQSIQPNQIIDENKVTEIREGLQQKGAILVGEIKPVFSTGTAIQPGFSVGVTPRGETLQITGSFSGSPAAKPNVPDPSKSSSSDPPLPPEPQLIFVATLTNGQGTAMNWSGDAGELRGDGILKLGGTANHFIGDVGAGRLSYSDSQVLSNSSSLLVNGVLYGGGTIIVIPTPNLNHPSPTATEP